MTRSGHMQPLFDVLESEIGGRLKRVKEKLEQSTDFSVHDFVARCRDGAESLQQSYGLTETEAQRFAATTPETLMKLEELEIPPSTSIELNTATRNRPEWRMLGQLSTGQKATAVLLLLLLRSDAPLIVDQPEDDLDNRFITGEIVPRIREEKHRRQFVFSTHNANIPVLGDAELILGLTPAEQAGAGIRATIRRGHMGAIDEIGPRLLIEETLEGGRNAFETRRLKYGF